MPRERVDTLVVDLDGCLVRTDLLYEGAVRAIRRNPLLCLLFPFWLFKGKAYLKSQIAARSQIAIERLPYNAKVLELIEEYSTGGARVLLATASDRSLAELVARHLGRFHQVLASDGERNLAGDAKLDAILVEVRDGGFAYAGNDIADLPIWARSDVIYVVDPSMGVEASLRRLNREPAGVFRTRRPYFASLFRALRFHQWLKNLLVLAPILAAHRLADSTLWYPAIAIFVAFGLTASSVYLQNDLFDLDSDRIHPRKRDRPLASGDLPIIDGLFLALILFASGLALAFLVDVLAGLLVLAYGIASTSYSIALKRVVMLDVITLAGLYTLRILAGAAATQIVPSFWLLGFSMFLFLSLAMMKRAAELQGLAHGATEIAAGRDYGLRDLPTIRAFGASSGYLSVLVLAFYINAPEVSANYATPQALWAICIVLLYWLARLWIKTDRGEMDDDPIVFAVTDWNSRALGGICLMILLAATVRWT